MWPVVRALGGVRTTVVGVVFLLLVFMFIAMENTNHFGWGFRFIDTAILFAALLPIVLLLDGAFMIAAFIRRRRMATKLDEEAHAIVLGYILVVWGGCALFFLSMLL